MIGEQKTKDEGYVSVATKVPAHVAELLTILARQRGMEVYELLQLLVNGFISAAKYEGPLTSDMKQLMDALKLDVAFNRAFNFSSPTAKTEIAQLIMVLQQRGKHGFGLTMIDKPFMGTPTVTRCLDSIIERVVRVAMPGVYRRLDQIGQRLCCASLRETLILLSEYMGDSLDNEEEQRELPGYGTFNDAGHSIEYGQRTKQKKHFTPDTMPQQQRIVFDDYDRDIAQAEVEDWEGEQRNPESDDPPINPFGVEW